MTATTHRRRPLLPSRRLEEEEEELIPVAIRGVLRRRTRRQTTRRVTTAEEAASETAPTGGAAPEIPMPGWWSSPSLSSGNVLVTTTSSYHRITTSTTTGTSSSTNTSSSTTSSTAANATASVNTSSSNGTTTTSNSSTASSSSSGGFPISSNESNILRQTFRLYGSIYLCCFVAFCYVRRSKRYAKFFNLRSWVPDMLSPLATQVQYKYWVGWVYQVFAVSDDDLLEHCGMDAICYLRALRFGRDLALVCCFNAIWLIPLYATAPGPPNPIRDPFVAISISNLSNGSPRFLGTVVAAYITFFATMYLLHRETRWFVSYRHKYLSMRKCCNYAVYVSGIPSQYRSSAGLAQYFRSCAGSVDAVLEAHVTLNVPDLENKVNRREHVVNAIEHAVALTQRRQQQRQHRNRKNSGSGSESASTSAPTAALTSTSNRGNNSRWRLTGSTRSTSTSGEDESNNIVSNSNSHRQQQHSIHHYKLDPRRGRLERVETISSLESELLQLDRDIRLARRQLLTSQTLHHTRRTQLLRSNASKNLMGSEVTTTININKKADGIMLRRPRVDSAGNAGTSFDRPGGGDVRGGGGGATAAGAGGGIGGAAGFLRERLRTGTVDYDHGDAMDDELRRILVPDELDDHEYDDDDALDLEAADMSKAFDHYNPADLSSGAGELDDDELMEVIDALPTSNSARKLPSTSTIGKFSTTAVMDDPIAEEPSSPFDTDQSSKLTGSPSSGAAQTPTGHKPRSPDAQEESPTRAATSPLSCTDSSFDADIESPLAKEGTEMDRDIANTEEDLVDELNEMFGHPHRSLSSEECVIGLDLDEDEKKVDATSGSFASPRRERWSMLRDDWSSRRVDQDSGPRGVVAVDPLAPVLEGVLLESPHPSDASRPSLATPNATNRESSSRWSDRSGESGHGLSPLRTFTLEATQGCSKISLLSEPGSGRSTGIVDDDDEPLDTEGIRRQDSSSVLSVHSDASGKSTSKNSVLRSSISNGSRAMVFTSRRAGSGLVSAGSSVVKGSVAASQSLAKGSRVASQSIVEGSKEVSKSIVKGSRVATSAIKKVAKDTSMDRVLESVGETGLKTFKTTTSIATHVVTSAATVVPILANTASGSARDAGFVVFTNLFTTQAALQMVHHPKPTTMNVQEAPDPHHIFWRNVGMPHRARRTGSALSVAATATLCIFWSIPVAFISSLTEVNSLKKTLPGLGHFIEEHPWIEPIMALIAPLILLLLNETVLPQLLKFFAAWEGHISSAMLEASLFVKLGSFMIIQTFFVSIIGGSISAISAELQSILENPASIVNLLATALPAQSSYFMQILLTSTFLLQATELLRVYPLSLALLRRFIGPNLTEKERRRSWGPLKSLEDPPEFWHAETFAQVILYFVVTFVYATVAPVTGFFLLFCFILMESGYRYCYIHNYPPAFETGGRLWQYFLNFTLGSMVIGQLTLMGLLLLKQSFYAVPALGPLLAITILFCSFLIHENKHVMSHLPTRDCVVLDDRFLQEGQSLDFLVGAYLQPALKSELVEPEYDADASD